MAPKVVLTKTGAVNVAGNIERKLVNRAKKEGVSVTSVVNRALENYLKKLR